MKFNFRDHFHNSKLIICRLRDDRIGHLASNTDLFLRRVQLTKEKKLYCLGLASTRPANKQLIKMFQRVFPIIHLPGIKVLDKFTWIIINKPILLGLVLYKGLPFNSNEYFEFNNTERNLQFTPSEEEKGKKLLKKMGINENDEYICFHNRDPVYLTARHGRNKIKHHDFRDCEIKNFIKAAKYIASKGAYAIRMGYQMAENLPDLDDSRIIDYASKYQTDFGDIYLPANCKFFLGNTSGLWCVAEIFHVPVACTNFIPIDIPPFRKGDIFITKKIWSNKKKRFLTFRELFETGISHYVKTELYTKAGLKVIENSQQEILDLAKEMNERLNGTYKNTEKDEELQKKFWSLIKPHHHCYGSPALIGAAFLRKNKELLD